MLPNHSQGITDTIQTPFTKVLRGGDLQHHPIPERLQVFSAPDQRYLTTHKLQQQHSLVTIRGNISVIALD